VVIDLISADSIGRINFHAVLFISLKKTAIQKLVNMPYTFPVKQCRHYFNLKRFCTTCTAQEKKQSFMYSFKKYLLSSVLFM